jgi:putative transposase
MSLPRPIHPGSRYLLTRRTAHRQFLLRPSDETNRIVSYVLAEAAHATGVVVHAFVAMSNHIHAVVTDPDGRLPQFLHRLDRHIACSMNTLLGRTENFWASTPASVVALETDEDVLDKIAYVLANPTAAGLVAAPAQWPGVITPEAGMKVTVERPGVFFRPNGKMPASVELEIAVPRLAAYDGVEAVAARLRVLLAEKLRIARANVAATGRTFLGRQGVLSTSRSGAASTPEPIRARRPRFAARTRARRCSALDRLRAFHAHYARALHAWRAGNRGAVFPAGTYLMRVRHSVLVEAAPG